LSTVRTYLVNTAIVPNELDRATASTGFCVLRPTEAIEPRFLFQRVIEGRFVEDLSRLQTGSSYPAVRAGDVLEQRIALPPRAEQRRIAEALEAYLSRIESGSMQLAGIVARGLSLETSAIGRAFTLASASAGRMVPLHDIVMEARVGLDRGRRAQSPDPDGRYPYVRMQDITGEGVLEWDHLVFVEASSEERERFSLRNGDVLFNTRNSRELVGKAAPVIHPPPGTLYNNNLMRLRFPTDINPRFVCTMMRSRPFRGDLDGIKRTTTNVAAVYATDLLALRIPVPPASFQQEVMDEVDRQVSAARSLRESARIARRRAESLRASLLVRAFRGELVPQDPNDEPASVLLERIAAERAIAPKPKRGRKEKTSA
jgi:type I restriction enzyme S subunit